MFCWESIQQKCLLAFWDEEDKKEGKLLAICQINNDKSSCRALVKMLHLLFPEASVDDAAAEVVHPLPLDDVIEDELPGCGGAQLTWRQKQWDCNVISAQRKCSQSTSSVFSAVSPLVFVFRYLEQVRPFPERPTGSLRRSASWHRSWLRSSAALWPAPVCGGGCRRCTDKTTSQIHTWSLQSHSLYPDGSSYPVVSMKSTQRIISYVPGRRLPAPGFLLAAFVFPASPVPSASVLGGATHVSLSAGLWREDWFCSSGKRKKMKEASLT